MSRTPQDTRGQSSQRPPQPRENKNQALAVRNQSAIARQGEIADELVDLLPKSALDSIAEVTKIFEALKDKVNLVCPIASVPTIMAMHQISMRVVWVDPTITAFGNGPECYKGSFCDDDERALGKVALDKIEGAAGITRVPELSGRTDDRSDPDFCEFQVTLEITDFDGTVRRATGTKELDLRLGQPETMQPEKKKKPGDQYPTKTGNMIPISTEHLMAKKTHKLRLCETKARLAALRELLALKQKYTVEELAMPFVVPKLVGNPDINDPETRTMLIAKATGTVAALYGSKKVFEQGAPPALGPSKRVEGERILDEPTSPSGSFQDPELGERDDDSGHDSGQEQTLFSATTNQPGAEQGEDDLKNFKPPTEGPEAVCGCPCSHQKEISKEREAATISAVGGARCPECFPGRYFNLALHKDLASLELKGYANGLAPKDAAQMAKADRK